MASTELEPITGVWVGVGAELDSGGEAPSKLNAFSPFSYKRGAKR